MRQEEPDTGPRPPEDDDRESIWSIPPALRALYFALFTVYALAGIGLLVWDTIAAHPPEKWRMVVVAIAQGLGAATVGAAGLALLTIEGPKTVMIIADYIRKRWVIPLEEKQRAEAARINAETEAFLAKKREENIQEGLEEGREQGREEGREQGREEGREQGREEGREQGREEGHEQGREEGLNEGMERMRSQWQAWNERRLSAEARGEPFDEPPPGAA